MSLLNRKPLSIGRAQRQLRDDRVFVVATDDTYAPHQYFEHLPMPRVKVIVLPTPKDTGLSSPGHVVERLREAFHIARQRRQVQQGDEFWVFLDTDHYIRDQHLPGMLDALSRARQSGFEIAVSNPCFELWLLLHHEDVAVGSMFTAAAEVENRLRACLGSYNKALIVAGQFPMARVPDAIRRARVLETSPDMPEGLWPQKAGSRIYRLLERTLPQTP